LAVGIASVSEGLRHGFFKYAVKEELLEHSPGRACTAAASRLRVPRRGAGPQRARRATGRCRAWAADRACLISLLALNGLRVSEATGADFEHLGLERGAPDTDHHLQGRQDHRRPAGAAYRPGDRPGYRRADRGPGLPDCWRGRPEACGSRPYRNISSPRAAVPALADLDCSAVSSVAARRASGSR
jgi:integrase